MKVCDYYNKLIKKEITDSLIFTIPRSVSSENHNFRDDSQDVIPQDKANRLKNVSCEPVYAERCLQPREAISFYN